MINREAFKNSMLFMIPFYLGIMSEKSESILFSILSVILGTFICHFIKKEEDL